MKKNNFFGLLAMTMGLSFLMALSCSKDDGCVTKTYYLDKDKDNFGAGAPKTSCSPPTTTVGQYVLKNGDADDNDPNINPGCDLVFYLDEDNDGFGTGDPILFCKNPDEDKYTDNDTAFDCDDTNPSINPDVFIKYYPDVDNDGYGDSEVKESEIITQPACDPAPEGYADNGDDCDDANANAYPGAEQIIYYSDADQDGYGSDEEFLIKEACDPAPEFNYSFQGGDCDDNDSNIHPSAEENPNDGVDSNCDGEQEAIIWAGEPKVFTKAANDEWASSGGTNDPITENITLTRSTKGYITNIKWWSHVIGETPTENEDLTWEYEGRKAENPPVANVGNTIPNGGPHGVRWAILEQGVDTPAWDNFDQYGTLGDPTHFYSLNNIVTMCALLDFNREIFNIVDDFGLDSALEEEPKDHSNNMYESLVGKTLGVWLVEENIYFTLRFNTLSNNNQGGEMSYVRSTPTN